MRIRERPIIIRALAVGLAAQVVQMAVQRVAKGQFPNYGRWSYLVSTGVGFATWGGSRTVCRSGMEDAERNLLRGRPGALEHLLSYYPGASQGERFAHWWSDITSRDQFQQWDQRALLIQILLDVPGSDPDLMLQGLTDEQWVDLIGQYRDRGQIVLRELLLYAPIALLFGDARYRTIHGEILEFAQVRRDFDMRELKAAPVCAAWTVLKDLSQYEKDSWPTWLVNDFRAWMGSGEPVMDWSDSPLERWADDRVMDGLVHLLLNHSEPRAAEAVNYRWVGRLYNSYHYNLDERPVGKLQASLYASYDEATRIRLWPFLRLFMPEALSKAMVDMLSLAAGQEALLSLPGETVRELPLKELGGALATCRDTGKEVHQGAVDRLARELEDFDLLLFKCEEDLKHFLQPTIEERRRHGRIILQDQGDQATPMGLAMAWVGAAEGVEREGLWEKLAARLPPRFAGMDQGIAQEMVRLFVTQQEEVVLPTLNPQLFNWLMGFLNRIGGADRFDVLYALQDIWESNHLYIGDGIDDPLAYFLDLPDLQPLELFKLGMCYPKRVEPMAALWEEGAPIDFYVRYLVGMSLRNPSDHPLGGCKLPSRFVLNYHALSWDEGYTWMARAFQQAPPAMRDAFMDRLWQEIRDYQRLVPLHEPDSQRIAKAHLFMVKLMFRERQSVEELRDGVKDLWDQEWAIARHELLGRFRTLAAGGGGVQLAGQGLATGALEQLSVNGIAAVALWLDDRSYQALSCTCRLAYTHLTRGLAWQMRRRKTLWSGDFGEKGAILAVGLPVGLRPGSSQPKLDRLVELREHPGRIQVEEEHALETLICSLGELGQLEAWVNQLSHADFFRLIKVPTRSSSWFIDRLEELNRQGVVPAGLLASDRVDLEMIAARMPNLLTEEQKEAERTRDLIACRDRTTFYEAIRTDPKEGRGWVMFYFRELFGDQSTEVLREAAQLDPTVPLWMWHYLWTHSDEGLRPAEKRVVWEANPDLVRQFLREEDD